MARRDDELDKELRFHMDERVADLVRSGTTPEEARRRARLEFGGVMQTKEAVRDQRASWLMAGLWQDLRYALRMMHRSPGFAAVAVLSLALGIGANTAIFSLVNGLLLRTLPVRDPHRLVTLWSSPADKHHQFSYATWKEVERRAQYFDGAIAWSGGRFAAGEGQETHPVDGVFASGAYFTTLGVPALVGRTFTGADDRRGGGPDGAVAVISYELWQRSFGGAGDVLGRGLVIDRVPFTIVGVTPPEFFGVEVGRSFDVALPIGAEPLFNATDTVLDKSNQWLHIMLQLKAGQSAEAATATLRALQPDIRAGAMPHDFPELFLKDPLTLVPSASGTDRDVDAAGGLRQRYERPLLTILAIVTLVLLIACANIANLLLARAAGRRHELSVRLALGASRWRIARQLLLESLMLAATGTALGAIFAGWASQALVQQLSSYSSHVFLDLSVDWRVMVFTATVTVTTALLFGTVPALWASRAVPMDALREQRRIGSAASRAGVSGALVIAQIALSLVLVMAAGLFVRTFERLTHVPFGFDSDRVLIVGASTTRTGLAPGSRGDFFQRLVAATSSVPGVARASGSIMTPISGADFRMVVTVRDAKPMPARERATQVNFITPGWFATYGTTLRAGRDLDERDTNTSPPVMLVNDAFVRKFLAGGTAVGRPVAVALGDGGEVAFPTRTIIGVVENAVYRSLREAPPPTIYMPLAQWDVRVALPPTIFISARVAAGSPVRVAQSIATALTAVDRNLSFTFRPLADQVSVSLAQERIVAMLAGFFGILALVLAGVGLYGLTSYAVSARRIEIGIRMALGAAPSGVVRLVLARVAILVGAGIVIGAITSLWASTFVASLLFGLEPHDPVTLVGAAITLGGIGALAGWLPAWRASRIDPAEVLRES